MVTVEECLIQAPGAEVVVEGEVDRVGEARVLEEQVRAQTFEVDLEGFWQVHVGAPETLVSAVLEAADVRPGDRVADLYSGVGLYTAFLAEQVGPTGRVHAVEGDRVASEHAEANLAAYPWVSTVRGPVDKVLRTGLERGVTGAAAEVDVVVLDPPREGARRAVVEGIAALAPRTVVLVACDPASFARDVALFAEAGYELGRLRAFDLFPMTHHVECVALLERTGS